MDFRKSQCVFMFLAMSVVASCSTAGAVEVKELISVVKDTVLVARVSEVEVCENGRIRADFNFRRQGPGNSHEVLENYEWPYVYCYGNGENYLEIQTPLDNYYMSTPNEYFKEPVCTGGPASISFGVYRLFGSGIVEEDEVYAKLQNSCGSGGCSYSIKIKRDELDNMCFDPIAQ